jgi:hypothetical protein
MFGSEWQPLEWTGDDLSHGIDTMVDVGFKFQELDDCTSDINSLVVFDKLEKEMLIRKAELLLDQWGIVIFQMNDTQYRTPLWCALTGFKDMLDTGDWATAEANADLAVALGGLDPVKAGTTMIWRRDMVHRISARNSDGEVVRQDEAERERRRPAEQARSNYWCKRFHDWHYAEKWQARLNEPIAEKK